MAGYRVVLCFFSSLIYFSSVFCAKQPTPVPVILWQSSSVGSGGLSSVSVIEPLTKDEFNKDVLQKLTIPGPIVMFVEPKLSLEDFTLWSNPHNVEGEANVFKNLKSIVMSNPASMLPAVEFPEKTLREFSTDRQIIELDVSSAIPNSVDHSLLIVKLPDGKNRQKTLATGDELMGEFVRKISSKYPTYTGVYTGSKSSWSSSDVQGDKSRIKRHILAVDEKDNVTGYFFNNTECFLVYYEYIEFRYYIWDASVDAKGRQEPQFKENLTGIITANVEDHCTPTSSILVLSYQSTSDTNVTSLELKITFEFKNDSNWYATDVEVKYTIKDDNESRNNSLNLNDFWAPKRFAYHCSATDFTYDTYDLANSKNESNFRYADVYISNFQVQPFNRTGAGFDKSWDCIGFFTIGIWMAIVVIAILIIVLGFGIYMTFIIKTMDRFDDPKGKTISISAID